MKIIPSKRALITGFIIIFGLIQFIRIDKVNTIVPAEHGLIAIETPPEDVAELITSACYDCHSNTTKYPWYSNIAPVSWWLKKHVNNAREELNFSKWKDYNIDKRDSLKKECAEHIEKKWMPLFSYKIIHPEAQLSDEEREKMINWFKQ